MRVPSNAWPCRVYTIEVRGLAVNGEEVDGVDDDAFQGGTIVDSGTTAVIFPNDAYRKLRREVCYRCANGAPEYHCQARGTPDSKFHSLCEACKWYSGVPLTQ